MARAIDLHELRRLMLSAGRVGRIVLNETTEIVTAGTNRHDDPVSLAFAAAASS